MNFTRAYRGDGTLERDSINVLDCVECGIWFPTFERLAKHVAAHHDPLLVRERNRATQRTRTGVDSIMAKSTTTRTPKTPKKGGSIPPPSGDAPSNFAPFLKAADIGDVGARATIRMVGEPRVVDGNFGEQIVIPIKLGTGKFDWAITIDSVNHRILHDRFGANSSRWTGPVKVTVKESRQNRPYIAVER